MCGLVRVCRTSAWLILTRDAASDEWRARRRRWSQALSFSPKVVACADIYVPCAQSHERVDSSKGCRFCFTPAG